MKIATLTTHRADNYGAVLQAYALQKKINDLGISCEILDYTEPFLEKLYQKPWQLTSNPLKKTMRLLRWGIRDHFIRKKFNAFRSCMNISKETYRDFDSLCEGATHYDRIIVGSDQMWNPVNYGRSETIPLEYFLHFADKKQRFAYAVSVGRQQLPMKLIQQMQMFLPDFQQISCREQQGAKLLEIYYCRSIEVSVDPVFLLDAQDWEQNFPSIVNSLRHRPYLFLYNILPSETLVEYAKRIAKDRNLDLVMIQIPASFTTHGFRGLRNVGPIEFVSLIRNAEVIVGNSFHGAAFSAIFGKELHLKYEKSSSACRNSRFENLFSLCGLTTKDIQQHLYIGENIAKMSFHASSVMQSIQLNRQKSLEYLKTIIS